MKTAKYRFNIRKCRVRSKINCITNRPRLLIFKSNRHIYAQIIDDNKSAVIASACSLEKSIKQDKKSNCNKKTATKIGNLIGIRGSKCGIQKVVFDKSGNKYHGVIKALANAARINLNF